MPMLLEITTAERQVFGEDVDMVIAPGVDGQLGILPRHAPLMTMLQPGELTIRKGGADTFFAVSGGFMEVLGDHVIILADACERSDEISEERAQEAMRRAQGANRQSSLPKCSWNGPLPRCAALRPASTPSGAEGTAPGVPCRQASAPGDSLLREISSPATRGFDPV